jgi:hypothetical protein
MRGAPARAIQELAGPSELTMTQRYMHLSPAALDAAIQLLDGASRGRRWQRRLDSENGARKILGQIGGEAGIRTLKTRFSKWLMARDFWC